MFFSKKLKLTKEESFVFDFVKQLLSNIPFEPTVDYLNIKLFDAIMTKADKLKTIREHNLSSIMRSLSEKLEELC